MRTYYRHITTAAGHRLMQVWLAPRTTDRGEIPANIAWVGGMVVLAVGVIGIISGKAQAFAESIDFGP